MQDVRKRQKQRRIAHQDQEPTSHLCQFLLDRLLWSILPLPCTLITPVPAAAPAAAAGSPRAAAKAAKAGSFVGG